MKQLTKAKSIRFTESQMNSLAILEINYHNQDYEIILSLKLK